MVKKLLVIICIAPIFVFGQNQEVATFISYNILNFRNETSFCTNSNNNPIAKENYMKTIFGHVQPDLIACNEIGASASNAAKILDRCLNVDGETKFVMAPFNYSSGSSLANAFYYNSDMFSLKGNDKITEELNGDYIVRLIDVFYLYYNDNNLSQGADTTFLTVFVAHFKAGSSNADEAERDLATEAVMDFINSNNISSNYLIAGDFNVYDAAENAFQNLVDQNSQTEFFIDPINKMGSWNNNSAFAEVHTQSTHSTSNGCASGGGLDDRFDFILISDAIKNNTNRIDYVTNSYKAVANDGNHFNSDINSGTNNSVPPNVLDAIYNCSDHLPVVMDMILTEAPPNGITSLNDLPFNIQITNPSTEKIHGILTGESGNYTVKMYAITGSLILNQIIHLNNTSEFTIPMHQEGIFMLEIVNEVGFRKTIKVIVN